MNAWLKSARSIAIAVSFCFAGWVTFGASDESDVKAVQSQPPPRLFMPPHTLIKTPALKVSGQVFGQSSTDKNSIRLIQRTGFGGVEGFKLLRDPFLSQILEMERYEDRFFKVRVVTVPLVGQGHFEYTFAPSEVYGPALEKDDSPIGFVSFLLKTLAGPERVYGIQFFDGRKIRPTIFELDKESWEFKKLPESGGAPPISAELRMTEKDATVLVMVAGQN